MIDEKKVALMTKLAIFEKHESNDSLVLAKYYKNDYVRFNMLKTLVAATVVYWSIVAAYVFMKFDHMLAEINKIDYFDLVYKLLLWYVMVLVVYFFFSTMVYSYRYYKARAGLTKYNANLKKLIEYEGGSVHKGKVIKTKVVEAPTDEEMNIIHAEEKKTGQMNNSSRGSVSRMAMVRQNQQEADKIKQQQIIDNLNQRNARLAAQNEAKIRQQQQREHDRQMIQERRRQLEQAQMEKIRTQAFQQTDVGNYTAKITNSMEGRDK